MSHQFRKLFLISIVVCPLLGLLTGGVFTWYQPKTYKSRCVFQLRPPSAGILRSTATPSTNPALLDSTMPVHLPLVTADKTLDTVIDDLSLTSRWDLNRHSTRERLLQSIQARVIPGTALVEIRVYGSSAVEAFEITERLADATLERISDLEEQRYLQALNELRDAVQKQEDTVEDKRKTLTTIIRNQELIHNGRASKRFRGGNFSADDEAKAAAASYAELSKQRILLQNQIETLLKLDGDQLMGHVAGLQLPDNTIRTLHPRYLEAKRTLDALKIGGLGDAHPTVKQQRETIDGLREDLNEGVVALRETLRAQLELATEQMKRLRSEMKKKKDRANYSGIGIHGFDDAKREFETSQRLLEQLKIKLVSEEMSHRIVEPPYIIHEDPILPDSPSYPALSTNLGIGLLGGLAAGIIAPFLTLSFLKRNDTD